ncbi:hypothetical protein DES36_11916 [Alkalibaculum bacchi]|uniref:Uncharacterized protein n=1 Tax=Alkalibaculum bacchi TaxID=645887 RepID=A0A366HYS4_9FIRM|nr:isopeptide-forming domain-containing fimbrial protein [Alkalibaculum bacchi]RBP59291.1 hypothetical protein DES36_11916 [Alkalibaculum bacchi]
MVSFKKKNIFCLCLVVLFLISGKVEANILNLPKLSVVSDGGVTIGPEYTFVPRVNSNTEIQPFGGTGWRRISWNQNGGNSHNNRMFRALDVSTNNSWKGNIGVRYTNVGNYNGQSLDLKITVNDWAPRTVGSSKPQHISFEEKNIAISTQGYLWCDFTWEYVRSGTNTPVNVSGYYTFSDIDLAQGVHFPSSTVSKVDRFIIHDRNNRLSYKNVSGAYEVYDGKSTVSSGGVVTGTDYSDNQYIHEQAFTFLYSNESSLRFRWISPSRWNNLKGNYDNSAMGEYFFYVIDKPGQTVTPAPTKEVSHTNNFNINQKLKHTVIHEVPQEDPRFYYSNYLIEDTLDPVLTNPKVSILNQVNENVTNLFNTSISGNKVMISASAATLNLESFYGERYHIVIESSVDRSKLEQNIGNQSEYNIKNKATLIANNKTYSTNEVVTQISKRTITINHIDNDTNKMIKSETHVVFDGDSYDISPSTDLKRGNYNYKPINTSAQRGTINGKNVTLDFYYTVPKMTVGINKIQIYTDKVTLNPLDGLPTNIYLKKELVTGSKLEDFDGGKVKVVITDKNKTKQVYSKIFNINDLGDKLQLKLPTNYLSKDEKAQYSIDLIIDNNGTKNYELISETPNIETYGHTSSEKVLSNLEDGSIHYTGVIMTEKEIDKDVVEYKETLLLGVSNVSKQKTGYGFEVKLSTVYSNDLKKISEINANLLVDDNLVDSYLQYSSTDGMAIIPMDITQQTPSSDGKSISKEFKLPHVNIEKNTGNLFTDQQVSNNDNRINYEILDGGRKFYIPIWADLGDYDYKLKSNESIGVHEVTFDIKNNINVYAYMYGHIGSGTIKEDEILITPVDPQNPFPNGLPNGWTNEDVEWLKK